MAGLDYLDHLERESARFAAVLLRTDPRAPVPTCPGWTADDLLWHLAEWQWFWGEIVRSGTGDPETVEQAKPARPDDRAARADFFRVTSAGLVAALAAAAPDDQAWTWHTDRTTGFIRRRQAHEALIHRVDAEVTAAERSDLDPLLSSDGVDEALRVFFAGAPPWGTVTPEPARTLRVATTDTNRSWFVAISRFVGTDPDDGRSYDDPILEVAESDDGRPAAATLSGRAGDVDCLVWNRPPFGAVARDGDRETLAAFDTLIADGVQ